MLKNIIKNCIPSVFSLMLLGLYGVIDGLFIGNTVGDTGLSAINIAWPIAAFITALGAGVGIGGSVLISHKRGQGKTSESTEVFQNTFTLLVLTAIAALAVLFPTFRTLLTWLGARGEVYTQAEAYAMIIICGCIFQIIGTASIPILRNYELPFHAMLCMMSGTILNIVLNYILIIVLRLGIAGSAYGTILSQCVVSILAITIIIKKVGLSFKPRLDLIHIKQITKIGITGFGVSLAPSVTLMFTNLQCLAYGSDAAVASYAVISYISFPAQSMLQGVGEGTQPMMSFYSGVGDDSSLHKTAKISRILILIFGLFISISVLLLSPVIGQAFGLSEAGKDFFNSGIMVYALSFIVMAFCKFNLSYLNATLQTTKSIALTYMESLLISPILIFVLPHFFDITGIWLSYPATALVMLIIYTCFMQNHQNH
ncbi:MAG: MATE family efflux transporter [Lachnospiraceae bacterium]